MKSTTPLLRFTGKSRLTDWVAIVVAVFIAAGVLHRTSAFGMAWDYVSSGKRRELPIRMP